MLLAVTWLKNVIWPTVVDGFLQLIMLTQLTVTLQYLAFWKVLNMNLELWQRTCKVALILLPQASLLLLRTSMVSIYFWKVYFWLFLLLVVYFYYMSFFHFLFSSFRNLTIVYCSQTIKSLSWYVNHHNKLYFYVHFKDIHSLLDG